jgi:hypothetical protein
MGDKAAAAKHGISDRQVRRYRVSAETSPDLAAAVLEKRRALTSDNWLRAAKAARQEALERGLELVRHKKASLHGVTGFFKIVHDAVMAEELLLANGDGEADGLNRQRDGLAGQGEESPEAEGGGTTTH